MVIHVFQNIMCGQTIKNQLDILCRNHSTASFLLSHLLCFSATPAFIVHQPAKSHFKPWFSFRPHYGGAFWCTQSLKLHFHHIGLRPINHFKDTGSPDPLYNRVFTCLADLIACASSRKKVEKNIQVLICSLFRLDFIINCNKSALSLTHRIEYLGYNKLLVFLSQNWTNFTSTSSVPQGKQSHLELVCT